MSRNPDLSFAEGEAGRHHARGIYELAAPAYMKAARLAHGLADKITGECIEENPAKAHERRDLLERAERYWRRAGDCCDRIANDIGRHPDRIPPGERRNVN